MKYSEWKIHNGGPCPVSPDTKVQVQFNSETRKQVEEWYEHVEGIATPKLDWESVTAYREVIEPKRETAEYGVYWSDTLDKYNMYHKVNHGLDKYKITFETEDGEPVVDTIKMIKLEENK